MTATNRTYGEVEGLITMLLAACDDMGMNETLEMLLSQPDARRKAVVRELLDRFIAGGAPKPLYEAFACLLDDEVAEKAYEVIFQCKRNGSGAT